MTENDSSDGISRRQLMQLSGGAVLAGATGAAPVFGRTARGDDVARSIRHRVVSRKPPVRWEDAMLSGNGSTGIMVMGLPLEDLVIVNHEKLWVVANDYRPRTPDLRQAWREARRMAQEGRYRDADLYIVEQVRKINRQMYGPQFRGHRPQYDRTHPAFHLHVSTASNGAPLDYRRQMHLDSGEVSVHWTDNRGPWRRRLFVSRVHDVIVMELTAPVGSSVEATLRLAEAPGKREGDIAAVRVEHEGSEMYYHATYGRKMGKARAEGYHALGRVVVEGGSVRGVAGERLEIRGARRAVMLMRLEYLEVAESDDRAALRRALAALPADYEALLKPHAAEHGRMYHRVQLELSGSRPLQVGSSEQLLAEASAGRALPEFFEMMHAVGRYALICCGTGQLPPSLMGIWGNQWSAPWDGRYTFDANLNLAISAASQGNLPEVMATYTAFLERYLNDWRENARRLYGCGGVVTDLCQGWRHGAVLMPTYPWTGGAGWLASYLYDHYLFTQDRSYLRRHVVPLLKEVARFYADFVQGYPEHNGRVTFYPSISPENVPVMKRADQATNVVPNATCEIAICRQSLTNLLEACRQLGVEGDQIPRWQALLDKLPDYVINADGALAEWAWPGLGDQYNHRHSSHLYGIYPSLEISPDRTPRLFEAARVALEKRLEAGLGGRSAHGLMHVSFVAARLKNARLMQRLLLEFARLPFVNTSFITCHNPGPRIYNLDTTFCMPAVLMEMLVYSEPGLVEILPALPQRMFPRGTLRGVLGRGGWVVEQLHWNMPLGQVDLTLRWQQGGELQLRSGVDLRFFNAAEASDRDRVQPTGRNRWQVRLPPGRSLRLLGRR